MAKRNYNWEGKDERAATAKLHTAEMKIKYPKEISESFKKTKIYDINFSLPASTGMPLEVIVEDLDSVSAIFNYWKENEKIAVLNFSSYKNPGGGFLLGRRAQEECLCHESNLYNILLQLEGSFYSWNNLHKNKALYLNRGLYTPNVIFERNEQFVGEIVLPCDVITCASPNKTTAQKWQNVSNEENSKYLRERIKFVLDIAKDNKVDTLILGAYGCGVFGQNPVEVTQIFKEYLTTTHKCFKKVVFAIPSGNNNLPAFMNIFSKGVNNE